MVELTRHPNREITEVPVPTEHRNPEQCSSAGQSQSAAVSKLVRIKGS